MSSLTDLSPLPLTRQEHAAIEGGGTIAPACPFYALASRRPFDRHLEAERFASARAVPSGRAITDAPWCEAAGPEFAPGNTPGGGATPLPTPPAEADDGDNGEGLNLLILLIFGLFTLPWWIGVAWIAAAALRWAGLR